MTVAKYEDEDPRRLLQFYAEFQDQTSRKILPPHGFFTLDADEDVPFACDSAKYPWCEVRL